MGPALQNLERLLSMPFGCGEQNMVQFAPNIFILQYLNKTKQLDPEIEARAIRFLKTGKHCPSYFYCKTKVLQIKSVGHRSGGEAQGRSGALPQLSQRKVSQRIVVMSHGRKSAFLKKQDFGLCVLLRY